MQSRPIKIKYQDNGRGSAIARLTLAKAEVEAVGYPIAARITWIGPTEEGGPAWVVEPEVVK